MARRGAGEGSIYQRTDGLWVASLTVSSTDGKQQRLVLYAKTKALARDKLDRARAARTLGQTPPAGRGRITVGDLLAEWLEQIERASANLRELTAAQYRTVAVTRVQPYLGALPIARLDDDTIADWQDKLLAGGYTPRSVHKARTVLNGVIKLARRRKYLFSNPLELVEPPSAKQPAKRAITGEEAGRFFRALRGHPYETLFLAELLVGTRRGETLGWTWSNLDLAAGTVTIKQQLQRMPRHQGLRMIDPKTDSSARVLPLPGLLVDRLRLHPRHPASDLVFCTERGSPIDPRNYNRAFKRLVDDAGLAPLTPHELRHSMSTILLHLGVQPTVVARLLGHADPSVTLRWYSHAVPEDEREAMNRMDEYARRLVDEHVATGLATAAPSENAISSSESTI